MKTTMKTSAMLILSAIFMMSCQEEEIQRRATKEALTSVTTDIGTYTLNYDESGAVSSITYNEKFEAPVTYTFNWNSNARVYTVYAEKSGKVQAVQHTFNADSMLTDYRALDNYEMRYEFDYVGTAISKVRIFDEDLVLADAPVTISDVSMLFNTETFGQVSLNYEPGTISPLTLLGPEMLTVYLRNEVPVYFATSRNKVVSYNDNMYQINSIEYNVSGDRLMSNSMTIATPSGNGEWEETTAKITFNYGSIEITK